MLDILIKGLKLPEKKKNKKVYIIVQLRTPGLISLSLLQEVDKSIHDGINHSTFVFIEKKTNE